MNDARFDRQLLMFGAAGQQKLEAETAGIVGLGGTGSHIAPLLAYLGVRRFGLIDDDRLDETNLNRVMGAAPYDVGRLKTEVAQAHVRKILPGADATSLPVNLRTAAAFDFLKQCSIILAVWTMTARAWSWRNFRRPTGSR